MAADLQQVVLDRVERAIDDQWCSAAAVVVKQSGRTLARVGAGVLGRIEHDPDGTATPVGGRLIANPVAADALTWFDLASVTKVFSAVTLLSLVESGRLDLDEPIATHLPSFATNPDRQRITLRMLLTHTAGLPPTWMGWFGAVDVETSAAPGRTRDDLLDDLLQLPLDHSPATAWQYSCVGYNTAMALAETVTGREWGDLVEDLVLAPLDLSAGIAFSPAGPVAATEYEPEFGRGVVQGIVHDETAWALGGRCANAGLFGTVDALATFAEALRTDELPCRSEALVANALPGILGRPLADEADAPWGHSLGLRIGQDWMGSASAVGHTGFTGTSIMVDRDRELSVVVLANRVHPRRRDDQVHRLRAEVCAAALATAAGAA
ncbi:serine hydrolase domain-containing protein [Propionibacteriaceae bacterium G1746]|uniref:serine hydrolase domain-containing protein n=1 Tax=Aestuariimicrobium sp. G57 TaxID=3418485 RepID=UPI003C2637A9